VSVRLTEAEAVGIMNAAGLSPSVPYVSVNSPWLSVCLKCKQEVLLDVDFVQETK
jgi:hypothetical protein